MKLRKSAAILLTLAMVLGISAGIGTNTLAAGTGTITVDNVGDATKLDVYQILTYNYDNVNNNYNTVAFAKNGYKDVFLDVLAGYGGAALGSNPSVSAIMLHITNEIMDASGAHYANRNLFTVALANALEAYINDTANGVTAYASKTAANAAANGSYTFGGLDTGYYLVIDRTGYEASTEVLVILQGMRPNAKIALKTLDYTTPVKTVYTPEITANGNSVNIGDVVDFKIELKIPNFSMSDEYSFIVYDIMDTAYDFIDTGVSYTLGGAAYSGPAARIATSAERADFINKSSLVLDGKQLIVFDFGDIRSVFAGDIGKTLIITYQAQVNNTIIDKNGVISNEAIVLENGNYTSGDGNTTTTKSYGFDFTKKNEDGETLVGVVFQLYRRAYDEENKVWLSDDNGFPITAGNALTFTLKDGVYLFNPTAGGSADLATIANGKLVIFGLAAGKYVLKEISTLKGYNNLPGPIAYELGGDGCNPYLSDTIVNTTGIILPGTGSIGTILFLIIGCGVILFGVAFVAINRKRIFGK